MHNQKQKFMRVGIEKGGILILSWNRYNDHYLVKEVANCESLAVKIGGVLVIDRQSKFVSPFVLGDFNVCTQA